MNYVYLYFKVKPTSFLLKKLAVVKYNQCYILFRFNFIFAWGFFPNVSHRIFINFDKN